MYDGEIKLYIKSFAIIRVYYMKDEIVLLVVRTACPSSLSVHATRQCDFHFSPISGSSYIFRYPICETGSFFDDFDNLR